MNTPARRRVLLGTAIVTVAGAVLVALAYSGNKLGLRVDTDKATVVNTAVAVDILLFAVVAAVLGFLAFWDSTGEPALSIAVRFYFSQVNAPRFEIDPKDDTSGWIVLKPFKQVLGSVVIRNSSKYAARNPSVSLLLVGVSGGRPLNFVGWDRVATGNMGSQTEFLWDGGADRMIHGLGARKLPDIGLWGSHIRPDHEAADHRYGVRRRHRAGRAHLARDHVRRGNTRTARDAVVTPFMRS